MGGSGGGGSSSGAIDYPMYMKNMHANIMTGGMMDPTQWPYNGVELDSTDSLFWEILTAVRNNPYSNQLAYNPDQDINAFTWAIQAFESAVTGFSLANSFLTSDLPTITSTVNTAISDAGISGLMNSQAAILADKLTSEVLPRYEVGMRDIGAVNSSAFVIGKALLEGFNTREISDLGAKLTLQNQQSRNTLTGQLILADIDLYKTKFHLAEDTVKIGVDATRVKVVMKNEQVENQLDINANWFRWGVDIFQTGLNGIGSIAGSAVSSHRTPTKNASILGGVMSGAAAGAAMAPGLPGIGAGIGAVVGGLSSMF